MSIKNDDVMDVNNLLQPMVAMQWNVTVDDDVDVWLGDTWYLRSDGSCRLYLDVVVYHDIILHHPPSWLFKCAMYG